MSGYYRLACQKHALLRHNILTLLHQTVSKNSLKEANYSEIPPKNKKNTPLETSKTENLLKMTQVRSKKQKYQK